VNFTGSSVDTSHGGIALTVGNNATDNQRMLSVAQPSTPYKLKAIIAPNYTENTAGKNQYTGIGFYDGTKILHVVIQINGEMHVYRWNTVSSGNTDRFVSTFKQFSELVIFQVEND